MCGGRKFELSYNPLGTFRVNANKSNVPLTMLRKK